MSAIRATVPTDILEVQAAEQRRRIHDSMLALRTQIEHKLDIRQKASEYVWPASGMAALFGLILGWGAAGMFSAPRH